MGGKAKVAVMHPLPLQGPREGRVLMVRVDKLRMIWWETSKEEGAPPCKLTKILHT